MAINYLDPESSAWAYDKADQYRKVASMLERKADKISNSFSWRGRGYTLRKEIPIRMERERLLFDALKMVLEGHKRRDEGK